MPELIASHWTLAGDLPFGASPRRWPLSRRLQAAADAGYAGVGVDSSDLFGPEAISTVAEVSVMARDAGVRLVEVELLTGWWRDDPGSAERSRRLLDAAATVGARHVKAGAGFTDIPVETGRVAERFAVLCDAAAAAGTTVVLELLPTGPVHELRVARCVVEAAAEGAGLLLDAWHVARGETDLADVAALPPGLVTYVELCDGWRRPQGPLLEDTTRRRRLCGDGELDVAAFVAAVEAAGYAGPWGVEILSDELAALPVEEVATATWRSAAALFAQRSAP